jgi:hypothetical protein
MSIIEGYKSRLQALKGNKNSELEQIKREIRQTYTLPSSREDVFAKDVDGVERPIRIQTTKKRGMISEFNLHPDDKVFPGEVLVGLLDSEWIVTEVRNVGEAFDRLIAHKVVDAVGWMKSPGVKVFTSLALYRQNVASLPDYESTSFFKLGTDTRHVIMPRDKNTEFLKRQKRLMIDKIPYQITGIERLAFPRCLILTLEETTLGQWDSETVCDEFEPVPENVVMVGPKLYGDVLIPQGTSSSYVLRNDATPLEATWTLTNSLFTIVPGSDYSQIVKAPTGSKNVGQKTVLTAFHPDWGTYSLEITCGSLLQGG